MADLNSMKDKLDFLESSLREDLISFQLLGDEQINIIKHSKLELGRIKHEVASTNQRLNLLKEKLRYSITLLRRTAPATSLPYLENKLDMLKINKAVTRNDFKKLLN